MRTGKGRGGRAAGFGLGGGRGRRVGKGRNREQGKAGFLSSVLALLGQAIPARRKGRRPDVVAIREPGSRSIDVPATSRVAAPVGAVSRNEQPGEGRLAAFVDVEKCMGCGRCASVCPSGAIIAGEVAWVDRGRCTGCGRCLGECPQGALALGKAR
jgi:ferredoxin